MTADIVRDGGSEELSLCSEEVVVLVVVLGNSCLPGQKTGCVDVCLILSHTELGVLESGDGLAELLSLFAVLDGFVKSALSDTNRLCSDTDTAAVESLHGNLEALAYAAEDVVFVDADVVVINLSVGSAADTHTLDVGLNFDTG